MHLPFYTRGFPSHTCPSITHLCIETPILRRNMHGRARHCGMGVGGRRRTEDMARGMGKNGSLAALLLLFLHPSSIHLMPTLCLAGGWEGGGRAGTILPAPFPFLMPACLYACEILAFPSLPLLSPAILCLPASDGWMNIDMRRRDQGRHLPSPLSVYICAYDISLSALKLERMEAVGRETKNKDF